MSGYEELLALADAATPGPWESGVDGWAETISGDGEDWCYVRQVGDASDLMAQMLHGQDSDEQTEADAAFIAAANPTAVKALVEELLALRGKVERVEAASHALRFRSCGCRHGIEAALGDDQ